MYLNWEQRGRIERVLQALQGWTCERVRLRLPGNARNHFRLFKVISAVCPPRRDCEWYKLHKAELVVDCWIRTQRRAEQFRKILSVTILQKPENMDVFEEPEMAKQVRCQNQVYECMVKTIREPRNNAFLKVEGQILGLYKSEKKKEKGESMRTQAEKEHNEEDIKM